MERSDIIKDFLFPLILGLIGFYLGVAAELTKNIITDWRGYNVVRIDKEDEKLDKTSRKLIFSFYRIGNKKISEITFDFAIRNDYKAQVNIKSKPHLDQTSKSLISRSKFEFKFFEKEDGSFKLGIQDLHKLDKYRCTVEVTSKSSDALDNKYYDIGITTTDGIIASFSKWYDFIYSQNIYIILAIFLLILPVLLFLLIYLRIRPKSDNSYELVKCFQKRGDAPKGEREQEAGREGNRGTQKVKES